MKNNFCVAFSQQLLLPVSHYTHEDLASRLFSCRFTSHVLHGPTPPVWCGERSPHRAQLCLLKWSLCHVGSNILHSLAQNSALVPQTIMVLVYQDSTLTTPLNALNAHHEHQGKRWKKRSVSTATTMVRPPQLSVSATHRCPDPPIPQASSVLWFIS